ncbi:MAG: VWA domain-containing protein [Spirochaetes bacterium]|nr:VWA domain-containing protein [Spirochaetota bacterium]
MFIHFNEIKWFFLLWLLPLVIFFYWYAASKRKKALAVFSQLEIFKNISHSIHPGKRFVKQIFVCLALTVLIIALAGPAWDPQPQKIERKGRDVVFVLDVSKSMLAQDLAPSRLERAKLAIKDCVDQLEGDRVGLVIFAGNTLVKCPLTLDYGFFRGMLDDISVNSVTKGGTKIGDALRRTLEEVYDDKEKRFKDIILITDGEDHDSFPVDAAGKAGERGIRLITIGLGDENTGKRIPIKDKNGNITFLKYKGNEGKEHEVWSRLDADTLRKMANMTKGGKYLNVSTKNFDLGKIYRDLILTAEQKALKSESFTTYDEKYQYFLIIVFILLGIELIISIRQREGAL